MEFSSILFSTNVSIIDDDDPPNSDVGSTAVNHNNSNTIFRPCIHATVKYIEFERHLVRGRCPDGSLMLLEQQIVRNLDLSQPFCLGKLGMANCCPRWFDRRLGKLLTELGATEPEDRFNLGEVITDNIKDVTDRVPQTREVVRLVLAMEQYDDTVYEENDGDGMVPTAEEAIRELAAAVAAMEVGANGEENCAICLDGLNGDDGGTTAAMPCKHRFHEGCIMNWLRKSHCCPICRFEMPAATDGLQEAYQRFIDGDVRLL